METELTNNHVRFIFSASEPYTGGIEKHVIWGIHCHDYYEIYLVTKGSCIHYANGKEEIMTRRNLFLIRPDDLHQARKYISDDFSAVNIGIRADEIENYLGLTANERKILIDASFPPNVMLSEAATEYLNGRMCHALELSENTDAKTRIMRGVMHLIIAELVYPSSESIEVPGWFSKMLIEYENEENCPGGIDKLVEYSGMSYSHVCHSFKKYMDITPSEYIINRRLHRAKRLLAETNMSVMDICYACGFDSSSYFYKAFQKNTGTVPLKYRKAFIPDNKKPDNKGEVK